MLYGNFKLSILSITVKVKQLIDNYHIKSFYSHLNYINNGKINTSYVILNNLSL